MYQANNTCEMSPTESSTQIAGTAGSKFQKLGSTGDTASFVEGVSGMQKLSAISRRPHRSASARCLESRGQGTKCVKASWLGELIPTERWREVLLHTAEGGL